MADPASRPRLRPVEVVVVPDERFGRALLLRDTQGIAPRLAVLPVDASPVVMRFDGRRTCVDVARAASEELGRTVTVAEVVETATELEEALFAYGPAFDAALARSAQAFRDAPVRAASHAGSAYHGEPGALASYLDDACLRPASGAPGKADPAGRLVGLIAPHIDPWRGARCYGEAYDTLRHAFEQGASTFVLYGTSHAPMRNPFTLCRKPFATPLGDVAAHDEAIDRIAAACAFDPYEDLLNHQREHSLEFQAVFLRHLFRAAAATGRAPRTLRIVPILAGVTGDLLRGKDEDTLERFFDAVRAVVDDEKAVVIAGADLAHVGPRFGDPAPYGRTERRTLRDVDHQSLDLAAGVDAGGFFRDVARDLDTRRVCGLAPIHALLRTIDPRSRGTLRYYEQTIDPEEGSIVSHAAMGFTTREEPGEPASRRGA